MIGHLVMFALTFEQYQVLENCAWCRWVGKHDSEEKGMIAVHDQALSGVVAKVGLAAEPNVLFLQAMRTQRACSVQKRW